MITKDKRPGNVKESIRKYDKTKSCDTVLSVKSFNRKGARDGVQLIFEFEIYGLKRVINVECVEVLLKRPEETFLKDRFLLKQQHNPTMERTEEPPSDQSNLPLQLFAPQ